jgi:hypothetical protein
MIPYPRPVTDTVPFPAIPLRTRATANGAIPNQGAQLVAVVPVGARDGSQARIAVPPVTVCGVTELTVFVGTVKSRSFHDGDGGNDGRGDPAPLAVAPGVDAIFVGWNIDGASLVNTATFELFSALAPNAIATTRWTRGAGPIQALTQQPNAAHMLTGSIRFDALFTLPANHALGNNNDAFAGGVPTSECGPYKIKLTLTMVNTSTVALWPDIAWTHFDVLVAGLELGWCPATKLADVLPRANLARDREVYRKLTDTTDARNLAGAFPTPGNEKRVYLDSPTFTQTPGEMEDNTFYSRHRTLWGDGPNIPIFARVLVRSAAGGAVFAPNAIGKCKVAWDWEDHGGVGASSNAGVNTWVQRTMSGPAVPGTDAPAPSGLGSNCLVSRGGKRGTGALTCFPAQPGKPPAAQLPPNGGTATELPFAVTPNDTGGATAPTWKWSAFSEVWPTGEFAGMTGVIFQPSRMAGDGYVLRAFFCAAADGNMKAEVDQGYPRPLSATTGVFRVFRYVDTRRVLIHGATAAAPLALAGLIDRWEKHFVHLRYGGVDLNWSAQWFTALTQAVGGASVPGGRPALPDWLRAAIDPAGRAHLVTFRSYADWRTAMEMARGTGAPLYTWSDAVPGRNDANGIPVPGWWVNAAAGNATPLRRPWALNYVMPINAAANEGQIDVNLSVNANGAVRTRNFQIAFPQGVMSHRSTDVPPGAVTTINTEVLGLLRAIAGQYNSLPHYRPGAGYSPIDVTFAAATGNARRAARIQNVRDALEQALDTATRALDAETYENAVRFAWAFEVLDVVVDVMTQVAPLPPGFTLLQLRDHINFMGGPIGKSFNARAGGTSATPGTLADIPAVETLEHEIGHAMFLNHHYVPADPNDPRRLHQRIPELGGRSCMMHYMPSTRAGWCDFCGLCTLRLRGWSLYTTNAAGVPNGASRALWYHADHNNGTNAGVPPDPANAPVTAMIV